MEKYANDELYGGEVVKQGALIVGQADGGVHGFLFVTRKH